MYQEILKQRHVKSEDVNLNCLNSRKHSYKHQDHTSVHLHEYTCYMRFIVENNRNAVSHRTPTCHLNVHTDVDAGLTCDVILVFHLYIFIKCRKCAYVWVYVLRHSGIIAIIEKRNTRWQSSITVCKK